MSSSRRWLSASFGSWAVQLVYSPRSAQVAPRHDGEAERAPERDARRALWPAFAAMLVAVATAYYALAHFLALPAMTRVLAALLPVSGAVAWNTCCGGTTARRLSGAARWPLALVMGVCALSLRWSENFAPLLEDQPNMQAAVFCGFVTLLSVLLVGARSGGRLVPVAAPLVPTLALLGLLCLVSVDSVTQLCFLVFAAAALYLLCYDRFLRGVAPALSLGVWPATPRAKNLARRDVATWARQSALVSAAWLALFAGGGALLFWPLQRALPSLATPNWEAGRDAAGARRLDYSGGEPVMELRGGSHALSQRVVLRVLPVAGASGGLWRGRVYERYERSLWGEIENLQPAQEVSPPPEKPRRLRIATFALPRLAPRAGRLERLDEIVVPLSGAADVIYSSGLPLSYQRVPDLPIVENAHGEGEVTTSPPPYRVRSFLMQPRLRVLDETPGFDARANNAQMAPALRASLEINLQLPADASARAVLRAVASQVRAQGVESRTPSQKVRAISQYLRDHCVYSLEAPAVPSSADATIFFLTESRAGACDMFASSAALLLREMGVPARVVTGFLDPATPDSMVENGAGTPVKVLRERDAHAWVEYYVPSFGWLSFDPTQNTREAPAGWGGRLAELFQFSDLSVPPLLLALPALGAGLLLAGLLWQRRAPRNGERPRDERQRVEAAYKSALHLLRRYVPHAPHLSPAEYETRVTQSPLAVAAKQEFSALTHLYLAARYGPAPLAGTRVEESLARLKMALKRNAKNAR